MRVLRDLSIRYKLTLLLLGIVSVVLLAVSVANVISEVQTTRVNMAAKYSTLAKIVAAQSAAALSIADVDASGAQQIVSDLAAEPSICFAALIDANGKEIVCYPTRTRKQEHPTAPQAFGTSFVGDGFLDVVEPVRLNEGAVIGRIYLRATTERLQGQIRRIVAIAFVVYLVALVIALPLSFVLQRFISAPILQLAQLTRRVSNEHNYSLLAESRGNDELGTLYDGFNTMLTEIRRRDDELERSNDELLRSNVELRQFAYVASHDLQEPLRSITSFCGMLQGECTGRLTSDADDYIDRIVKGAARMKSLVVDLLSYSRVSRDEQSPFTAVNMRDVVGDALENLHGSIEASGAEILYDELPTLFGDRNQLIQLLQNLIGNAILYRGERSPRIEIETTRQDNYWDFTVRDNGIGIAPEHHDQIFEIFKRLHGRHEYPGTGIGLAVCKKIVERHGGRIWVESRLGAGSAFRFTIHTLPSEEESNERETLLTATV